MSDSYLNFNGKLFLAAAAALVGSKLYAAHRDREATANQSPTAGMDPEMAAMYHRLRGLAVRDDWDTYHRLVTEAGMSLGDAVKMWEQLRS